MLCSTWVFMCVAGTIMLLFAAGGLVLVWGMAAVSGPCNWIPGCLHAISAFESLQLLVAAAAAAANRSLFHRSLLIAATGTGMHCVLHTLVTSCVTLCPSPGTSPARVQVWALCCVFVCVCLCATGAAGRPPQPHHQCTGSSTEAGQHSRVQAVPAAGGGKLQSAVRPHAGAGV